MAAGTQESQDISISPFPQHIVFTQGEMKYYTTRSYFHTFASHRWCARGGRQAVLLISVFSESPAKAEGPCPPCSPGLQSRCACPQEGLSVVHKDSLPGARNCFKN